MLELQQELERRLKQLRVRVDAPDSNTLFLRNVPANKGCFNKARTNLLIKRPHAGQPFIVCVDEDLEYVGTDGALLRAFAAAHRQAGWRVIYLAQGTPEDSDALVENALRVLGSDGNEPELEPRALDPKTTGATSGRLLESFACDITRELNEGKVEPTVGREDKIEEVVTSVLQWQSKLVVIVGPSGVGKTNLVYGVARSFAGGAIPRRVLSIDLGILMSGTLFDSERESLLTALFGETLQSPETVLVLDHLEFALTGVPRGSWLISDALDKGIKLMATLTDATAFDAHALTRRTQFVELTEPWPEEAVSILSALGETIGAHHRVRISESVVRAAVENAQWLEGCLPARAINVLDIAASRASFMGNAEVCLADIYLGCSRFKQIRSN